MELATDKQIAFFESIAGKHPEWTRRVMPDGVTKQMASKLIDIAKRGFDPMNIDLETGDELLNRYDGVFETWHLSGTEPNKPYNVVCIKTDTREVLDRVQNFTVVHQIASRRLSAHRYGVPYVA